MLKAVTLSPSDVMKLTGMLVVLATFGGFALAVSRFQESLVLPLLAAVLWGLAHATCGVVHRRYLALRGRLPRVPFSRIGAVEEHFLYDTLLNQPVVDILAYLFLFALGFFALLFWEPSILVLPVVYATTLYVDQRIIAIPRQSPSNDRSDLIWSSLLILQPLVGVLLIVSNQVYAKTYGILAPIAGGAFWLLTAVTFGLLLFFHDKTGQRAPRGGDKTA